MQFHLSHKPLIGLLATGCLPALYNFLYNKPVGLVRCLMCGLLFCVPAANADSDNFVVVTDIAPIHSLVSMVVGQQTDVKLLVPPSRSPHSFSLKPSQIRNIKQATLIVMLSVDFTPTLGRHLNSVDKSAVVLQLSGANSNHQINKRKELEPAGSQPINNEQSNGHQLAKSVNAIQWIDRIAKAAIALDKNNSAVYTNNARQAKADLVLMHKDFAKRLTAVQSAHYIVYHDAYQHFAHSYGLQKPIAIALSDARAPGAGKLRAMRAEAKQTQCVFAELQHDNTIVDTVTAGLPVKRATLDPIGSSIPIGANHYPQMMQALVNSFVDCLT